MAGNEDDIRLPERIDLSKAEPVVPPQAPEPKLDPLSSAGVHLAKIVLGLIGFTFVVLVAMFLWGEPWAPSALEESHRALIKQFALKPDPEVGKQLDASAQRLIEARKAFRDFWLQFAQMVLLNLLLPVLTAILGYIFGSRRESNNR